MEINVAMDITSHRNSQLISSNNRDDFGCGRLAGIYKLPYVNKYLPGNDYFLVGDG